MDDYVLTVGLEIHAELKTKTKLFCHSPNDADESNPNVNVCPICMGHPGTLPVLNKEALRHVLRVGVAVGGKLAEYTEFDRKNYFYPDIPKGYQISQYKFPLVSGGELAGVALTRVHLEEDTARSQHVGDSSLVDFNRAGVPLMELVTEPVVHTPEDAGNFARELQLLLRTLGVSDANMEKGEMRVEANISISKDKTFGTKVEVKNLNSFRSVERAIAYEVLRQKELLERGEKVIQETRGWDENGQKTFPQRLKESAQDYRYFPDPDIYPLLRSAVIGFDDVSLRESMPELPKEKRARYHEIGLKREDVEQFIAHPVLGPLYDSLLKLTSEKPILLKAANYISSDLVGLLQDSNEVQFTAEEFLTLMRLSEAGDLSSRGVKDVLKVLVVRGGDPKKISLELGLIQTSDKEALSALVGEVVKEHPESVADYRAGKGNALQYLVGQGMKKSKGSANPAVLQELLKDILSH